LAVRPSHPRTNGQMNEKVPQTEAPAIAVKRGRLEELQSPPSYVKLSLIPHRGRRSGKIGVTNAGERLSPPHGSTVTERLHFPGTPSWVQS
jgi:hypothetical protein